jgi:hypothetical protein
MLRRGLPKIALVIQLNDITDLVKVLNCALNLWFSNSFLPNKITANLVNNLNTYNHGVATTDSLQSKFDSS